MCRLKNAVESGMHTFLMIRNPMVPSDAVKVREIGVQSILQEPISKLIGASPTPEYIFKVLQFDEGALGSDNSSHVINIGLDTYFHLTQFWIMHGNTKMELTEREAAMLQFFIENEGRVVSNRVDGFEWDEDNGTDLINVNTGDRIGLKSPGAGVNFRVPSPGGVVQQWIGGTVENSGHTTFSVQLSYNIPYTPINASLSYSTATQSTINGSAGAQAYQNVNG
jgi:hypothetical protein